MAVALEPRTPDIRVNETPAPRLEVDPAQGWLQVVPPAARPDQPKSGEAETRYLDPGTPVNFPVAVSKSAPRGLQAARGTVSFFYCSKSAGWCRKGKADVEFSVTVK